MQNSTQDPVAAWESQIGELMRGGMTMAAATRQLVISQPALHRSYLAAFNARRPARAERSDRGPSSSRDDREEHNNTVADDRPEMLPPHRRQPVADVGGDAIGEWDQRVAEQIRRGLSSAEANRAVALADPDLQQRYVKAYGEAAAAGLRPGARHRARRE